MRLATALASSPSNGKLGPLPFIGEAFQTIRREEKRYENVLKLSFFGAEIESDVRIADGGTTDGDV